jgi:hypothetical protein
LIFVNQKVAAIESKPERRPRVVEWRIEEAALILVDELREYPHTPLPFRHWCHLVSDESFEELHEFAARLAIPRHRFQGDHYDLPPHVRSRAVELGATEVGSRELTRRMAGPRGDRVRRRRARS